MNVYVLTFLNDGDEVEVFGCFKTKAGANTRIKEMQDSDGTDCWPTDQFEINETELEE